VTAVTAAEPGTVVGAVPKKENRGAAGVSTGWRWPHGFQETEKR
jgi:hypothetical protein